MVTDRIRRNILRITETLRPEFLPLYAALIYNSGQILSNPAPAIGYLRDAYIRLGYATSSTKFIAFLLTLPALLLQLWDFNEGNSGEESVARGLTSLEEAGLVQRNEGKYSATETARELVELFAKENPDSPYHEILMRAVMLQKYPHAFGREEVLDMVTALDGFIDLKKCYKNLKKSPVYIQ